MNLDATTKSLEVVLGGTVSANQLQVTADYVDIDQTTFGATADAYASTLTNNVTAVTAVAAPGSGKTRRVTNMCIFNRDTAAQSVTVRVNNNSTIEIKVTISLPVNASLQYTPGAGWSIINGTGSSGLAGINAQTGTTYTLVLGDANYLVTMNNGSAMTLTVPTNASVAFPVGTPVYLMRLGAGSLTVAGAGGVTVNNASSLTGRAQYSVLTLVQYAANTWVLTGDMT